VKRLIWGAALLALMVAFLAPGPASAAQDKPRVGVLRFTNHTSAGWWSASVGEELSDMLASELVSTKAFDVLERKEIDAVLGEQDLGEGGRIDPATKAKLGRIKGAEYLIAATVSSYEEGTRGGGAGVRVGGLSLGGKKDKTYIAVDLKVINTTTGAIADARTIEAESSGSGFGAGVNLRGISLAGDTFKRTPAGKAIRACIIYMSEYLDCSLVQGKDASCMKKWDDMDRKRRERTKGTIDIQ
jgi:curli biogenesis system outer membrane secretion channel CsgG